MPKKSLKSPVSSMVGLMLAVLVMIVCIVGGLVWIQYLKSYHRTQTSLETWTGSTLRLDDPPDVVPMYWTGGLASTFRLCYHLFVERRRVRPIYVADLNADNRQSTHCELRTMNTLISMIARRFPQWQTMLLDQHIVMDVDIDPAVRKKVQTVLLANNVPDLYPELVQLSTQLRPTRPLEVVMTERSPMVQLRASASEHGFRKNGCEYYFVGGGEDQKAAAAASSRQRQFRKLFSHISFVLLDECFSIAEMKRVARRFRFADILDATWTCWHPVYASDATSSSTRQTRGLPDRACGRCPQCLYRQELGTFRAASSAAAPKSESDAVLLQRLQQQAAAIVPKKNIAST